MRIQLQSRRDSTGHSSRARSTLSETGYTRSEVLAATAILGFVGALLYGLFSPGLGVLQSAGQNLRATQILMQKAETLRLFTGRQVVDPKDFHQPLFVEPHDPQDGASPCGGLQYTAYVSAAILVPGERPVAFPAHMRPATVTLRWTSYEGSKPVVHTRELQTRLARNGMPKYIWGTL